MARPMVGFGTRLLLVVISILGIIVAMTGILELLAGGMGSFYPPALRFPGHGVVLTVAGYLMMVPMGWLYWRDAQSD
ncbi:hypothetical protein [Ectothiorhodospira mobilis]|uniref:hypothetical protein n=1 Tax=Ectothiorhodospira mobilis TaxID=195064 RepID=UPI001904B9B7|nr:hypothetical protein [Ectothiorhodospira mobilis]